MRQQTRSGDQAGQGGNILGGADVKKGWRVGRSDQAKGLRGGDLAELGHRVHPWVWVRDATLLAVASRGAVAGPIRNG